MQRHRYVDRQHTAPQQMKQHRQHRDRIARSCCACHQRCRRHEHPPQHLADVWQVMAGMPVAASHRRFAVTIGSGAPTSR